MSYTVGTTTLSEQRVLMMIDSVMYGNNLCVAKASVSLQSVVAIATVSLHSVVAIATVSLQSVVAIATVSLQSVAVAMPEQQFLCKVCMLL